jgi:hypothetical protein
MPQLCGAKCRCTSATLARAEAIGPEAVARLLRRTTCRRPVVPGRNRCYQHGGYSTGPRTAEGRERIAAAQRGSNHCRGSKIQVASGRYRKAALTARSETAKRITALVERRNTAAEGTAVKLFCLSAEGLPAAQGQ